MFTVAFLLLEDFVTVLNYDISVPMQICNRILNLPGNDVVEQPIGLIFEILNFAPISRRQPRTMIAQTITELEFPIQQPNKNN